MPLALVLRAEAPELIRRWLDGPARLPALQLPVAEQPDQLTKKAVSSRVTSSGASSGRKCPAGIGSP